METLACHLMRVLFVCMGNICRSPTAEAAFREALEQEGLTAAVDVDSAGLGRWHLGDPPDPRMRAAGERDGLAIDGRARLVRPDDFETFDVVLAMDRSNHEQLLALAPDAEARQRVRLFRDFDAEANAPDTPDPYYEGNFDEVVAIARRGAAGLLEHLRPQLERTR